MTMTPPRVTDSPEWASLVDHQRAMTDVHLRQLFADDPDRAARYTHDVGDLHVDLAKHRVTDETMALLVALARRAGVESLPRRHVRRSAHQRDRAPLRAARRAASPPGRHGRRRQRHRCRPRGPRGARPDGRVRPSGPFRGVDGPHGSPHPQHRQHRHRGQRPRAPHGSRGPPALRRPRPHRPVRVQRRRQRVLRAAITRPGETLFVIASKTFTTRDADQRPHSARKWLLDALGGERTAIARHFVAVSTNAERVSAFGIDPDNMFEFWDWVGGRYSLDSAIGLSLMLAIGAEHFGEMLDGFRLVDEHFRSTPRIEPAGPARSDRCLERQLPRSRDVQAVLPYSHYLTHLSRLPPAAVDGEQRQVRRSFGRPVTTQTGEIVWGPVGTNGQHAFYQLLHQGTKLVPCELIGIAEAPRDGR